MFMTAAERQSPPSPDRALAMRSPFVRLRELLADKPPGQPAISLAVGEPQHGVPSFVGPVLAASLDEFGKYPMNKGLDEFCAAAAAWLGRRFALPRPVDPATEVLVLNGSREGLFLAAIAAERWAKGRAGRPAILMPNPFYGAYEAGAVAAHAEPVYLPATAETGFLPDLDSLSRRTARRARSRSTSPRPANPQGSVAERRLFRAARPRSPAATASSCSATSATRRSTPRHRRPACSSMPGATSRTWSCSSRCRSARTCPACASASSPATGNFLARFLELRNVSSPQVPMPAQRVAIAAYADEAHVEESRALYAQKFDLADQILGDRYGYRAAGRRLSALARRLGAWRRRGGDAAAVDARRGCASFPAAISRASRPTAPIPGAGYIRVAMVQDRDTTAEALHRLVAVLG